jgi:AcrR family transcriptional regulator
MVPDAGPSTADSMVTCRFIDIDTHSTLTVIDMNERRGYTMTARAAAVAATRAAILDALVGLSGERLLPDIGLDDVAARAGVSVQTVQRHYGSRNGLLDAAVGHALEGVTQERRAPPGDVVELLRLLVEHYEHRGRGVLLLLAQENADPRVGQITESGRSLHRRWAEEGFAPLLPRDPVAREEGVDLLVVVTDVYVWKLLRLDRGLTRTQTQRRMHDLVRAVLAALGSSTKE